MIPTRKEVLAFTRKVRKYLDTTVYAALVAEGRTITRVDTKSYLKNNDFINCWGTSVDGRKFSIWEKASTVLDYGYFELEHTDSRGLKVPGMGMRSKANVLVYVLWNADYNRVEQVYYLNVAAMKKRAVEALAADNNIMIINGEGSFKVKTWKFNFKDLDSTCFVTFNPIK